jgi:Na+/melibiose symporter-like transporter
VTTLARGLHSVAAWLLAASVIVQAFLAGVAMLQLGGDGDFSTHVGFGYSVPGLLALIVLLTALVARLGRTQILLSGGLIVLYIIQTALPVFAEQSPIVAALHPANAFLLFGAAIYVARRQTRSSPAPLAVPEAPEAPERPMSEGDES